MLFRQVFDGLEAGRDGLVTVGVVGGKVAFLSSSLTTDTSVTNEVVLSPQEAVQAAARLPGSRPAPFEPPQRERPARAGRQGLHRSGAGAPRRRADTHDGVRRAYEVLLMDVAGADPIGAMNYIDAETGALLLRDGIVDYAAAPGVEGVPSLPGARLFDDRHPRALVLDHHALGTRLPAGGRQQRIAGAVGRRCGAGHAVVPHARQQRAGDGEVELERRQPTGHQLRSLGDPRLRVPVDEPVVRGPL